MSFSLSRTLAFIVCFLFVLKPGPSQSDELKWFASLYGGEVGYGSLQDTLIGQLDFRDSYFMVTVVGKELAIWREWLQLEVEAQMGQHWGYQDHAEFNAVLVLRWLPFWWDHVLDTSFAVGEGLSYATRVPAIEKDQHENTSALLNYLMFDIECALPKPSDWSLFIRLHHRSGVDGLFNDVRGASNALAVGLKYRY